jgi:hypothetical protein
LKYLALKPIFLECSDVSYSEEELISGKKLIETSNIRITPNNFESVSTMFNINNLVQPAKKQRTMKKPRKSVRKKPKSLKKTRK